MHNYISLNLTDQVPWVAKQVSQVWVVRVLGVSVGPPAWGGGRGEGGGGLEGEGSWLQYL